MPARFLRFAGLARIARVVLGCVVVMSLCLLLPLGLRIHDSLAGLRSEASDNLHWNLSQLEVDLVRLDEEVRVDTLLP